MKRTFLRAVAALGALALLTGAAAAQSKPKVSIALTVTTTAIFDYGSVDVAFFSGDQGVTVHASSVGFR